MAIRFTGARSAALLLLSIGWIGTAAAETSATTGSHLLVHGNYCGLGNNAPLPPVDDLDAACARHDDCTPDEGLPTKACHARLERDAIQIASDLSQPADTRFMAGLVATFASTAAYKATPEPAVADVALRGVKPSYAVLKLP